MIHHGKFFSGGGFRMKKNRMAQCDSLEQQKIKFREWHLENHQKILIGKMGN